MQLRSKYFTYPVIVDGGDFYVNSSFTTDAEKEMQGYDIKFTLSANLHNPRLEEMLKNGDVAVVHHIECPQTCYRRCIKTKENIAETIVKDSDVNGIVQICSFLIADKNLEKYSNDLFSSDYRGFKFDIDAGCVLAIGNQINFRINKVKDDLANTSSIFSVMPNLDPTVNSMKIDLTRQKIAIILPEIAFNIYKNMSPMLDMQKTMHSLIIIPALEYVLSELKLSKHQLYLYEDLRWYRNLKKACEKIGFQLTEETMDNLDILGVSQLLFGNPITDGLKSLAGTEDIYED
ncbi:MAG: hypothetical protein K6E47_17200 [Lachnospiraceae bacterium]|nr:hypothetical protein [Lachnospiraceae bacterium]